jgi:transcriptional regulator with XRE-family HTH domain
MPSHKLSNYLRSHRKRAGFTQDEIAWLLGCHAGTKVSRYERFARQPLLPTVLAYELIFRAPARELFAGVFQRVEGVTVKRAAELARRLAAKRPDRATSAKLAVLHTICGEDTNGRAHP